MGLINLYSEISNEHKEIKANGKIKDIIPDIDFNKSIILKAGYKITPDYEVKNDDVIYIRVTPRAMAAVVATAVVAFGVTSWIYGKGKKAQQEEAEAQRKAQRDAENLAQQIEQLPFIKGAQNKAALGNKIQYQIGDTLNAPYKITNAYYSIGGNLGEKQYLNISLSAGFGELKIRNVKIGDDSIIKNNNGISSGVHNADSNALFYDSEDKIEIRKPGQSLTLFNQKVIAVQDGAEIKHENDSTSSEGEPVIRTLADNAQAVEVGILFNGLRIYDSDLSTWKKRKATIRPYWTNAENPGANDWHEFYFEGMTDNTIEVNSKKTIRFVAKKTFTAAESYGKKIKIKVAKMTPKDTGNTNEDCYLSFYQTYCYDAKTSNATELTPCAPLNTEVNNKVTKIGLRLVANDNTKDSLNEINIEACALARIWNGTSWSTGKSATRNPAAWALELLTSDIHKHSKYNDNEINLDSFGELYEYCETNEFYCDGVLTSDIKKSDLIVKILENCNAALYTNQRTNKLEVYIDDVEATPVALLNSENISAISYSKDLSRKPDGLKVSFTNRDNWLIDTFYSMLDGEDKDENDVINSLALEYITTYKHAYKIAQRTLRKQVLQPREISVDVGAEAEAYPLYSTVLLQYQTFRQGLNSSVIAGLKKDDAGNITGVKISDLVTFEAGKTYGVIIQAQTNSGLKHYYKQVTGSGNTRELTFSAILSKTESIKPELGNIISFGEIDAAGEFGKITNVMKITGIEPNSKGGLTLKLKDYNENIYSYGGEIPPYKSNLTQPAKPTREPPALPPEPIPGARGENGSSAFNYLGIISSVDDLPANSTNGDYWLCGETFNTEEQLGVNNDILGLNGSDTLGVGYQYKKGVIYYSTPAGNWSEETDRNNYRYVVAVNDLVEIEEPVSGNLNTVGASYIGSYDEPPASAIKGDWFTYKGENTGNTSYGDELIKGTCYKFNGDTWEALDPNATENMGAYMQALGDVLGTGVTSNNSFNTLFAQILFANEAIINNLESKNITLRTGGQIKSENYTSGENGFKIDSYGDAEFNSGRFRAGLGSFSTVSTPVITAGAATEKAKYYFKGEAGIIYIRTSNSTRGNVPFTYNVYDKFSLLFYMATTEGAAGFVEREYKTINLNLNSYHSYTIKKEEGALAGASYMEFDNLGIFEIIEMKLI